MNDRELMQQALEKLEFFAHMKSVSEDTMRLITDLRERLAQPEQELVCVCGAIWDGQELVSTPSQRKPLSDEQIDKLPWGPHEGNPMTFAEGLRDFARAIETAHGIGEKPDAA